MKARNKRQVEIYLMVGALLLLVVGLPVGLWTANSFNGFLSGTYSYDEVENSTVDYYLGPVVDGKTTEFRYGSVNGTATPVAETISFDAVTEWDHMTLTNTGTDCDVIWNWNVTVEDLMQGKDYQLRMKFNNTDDTKLVINAVKYDGVALTSVQAFSIDHINATAQTVYWNWTPIELINLQATLNPDATDEMYFQIILDGYNTTDKLTAGDTIQFQFATGAPDNVYTFTSWQILTGISTIFGIFFLFVAFASTSYWNPLGGTKRRSGGRRPKGRKRSKKSKSSKGRRR